MFDDQYPSIPISTNSIDYSSIAEAPIYKSTNEIDRNYELRSISDNLKNPDHLHDNVSMYSRYETFNSEDSFHFRNISEVAAAALLNARIQRGSVLSCDVPYRLRRNAAILADGKNVAIYHHQSKQSSRKDYSNRSSRKTKDSG